MTSMDYVLGVIGMSSVIICRASKCGRIKNRTFVVNENESCVEVKVSRNYDEVKESLFVRYDSEILFDGAFKTKVIGDSKTKTIRIHVEEV